MTYIDHIESMYANAAARVAGRILDLAAIVRRHIPTPPTLSE